jgi:hypothetical protein
VEQALPWLIVLLIIVGVFWAISNENRRKRQRTAEEYEREVAESRSSLMRAGMMELDKFVGDTRSKRAAVEYLKDEEEGMTDASDRGDDAKRTEGRTER